jgi:hypothetical protein
MGIERQVLRQLDQQKEDGVAEATKQLKDIRPGIGGAIGLLFRSKGDNMAVKAAIYQQEKGLKSKIKEIRKS